MTNSVEQDDKKQEQDTIYNYHKSRMQLGLLFMNIEDSIKEGDGNRLLNCYKLVLLLVYRFKHTKYAYAILLLLAQNNGLLSEAESLSLISNRFANYKGTPGGNIPLDLHMEHMNMLVKRLAKAMGANVTEKSLQRAARSVLALNKVTEGIADNCSKKKRSGLHSQKNPEEAVKIIAHGLLMGQVFQKKEHRKGYPSFSKFKSNLLDVDYRDFFKWFKEKLAHWKQIYESRRFHNQ